MFMMTYVNAIYDSGSCCCIISILHRNMTLQVYYRSSQLEDQNVNTEPGYGTVA